MNDDNELLNEIDLLNSQLDFFVNEKESLSILLKEIDSLNGIEKTKVMIPVSKGIYMKIDVNKIDGFLLNTGHNVIVKKDVSKIKDMITQNLLDLSRNINYLEEKLSLLYEHINKNE